MDNVAVLLGLQTAHMYTSKGFAISSGQYRADRESENMFLPVVVAIVCITTHTITPSVAANRADRDVQIEDLSGRRNNSPDSDQGRMSPRSCTLNDEKCLTICCEPVRYDNRTTCYANASISSIKDIDFSAIPDCNLSILHMSPEELTRQRNKRFSLGQDTQYDIVFYVLGNGTIYENNSMYGHDDYWLDLENYYCLTSLLSEDGTNSVEAVCFPSADDNNGDTAVTMLYLVSTAVALPFLVATFIIYTILPRFRNMHGMTLRAYIGSLTVMFVSLIVSHFDKTNLCASLVFITYFTSLTCFSWVNVMSFDIWWTFRKYRSVSSNPKQSERRKWVMYSVFAWGSAALLTGVCATIDFVPSVPDGFIKPELGVKACWVFGTFAARAIYYYAPASISVIFNLVLFASTIRKINEQRKEVALHLDAVDSRRHNYNRERFDFSVKLCTMMIINSSMEIINCLCERDSLRYFWAILDLANTVQALTIFVIFVCTDAVKLQLRKRLGLQNGSFKSWSQLRKTDSGSQSEPKTITVSQ